MRIRYLSSYVCSSDLVGEGGAPAERRIGHASKCAMHADHVRSHELERLRGVAGICVELSESAVDIEAVGEDDEFLHRIFTALPPPVHEFRSGLDRLFAVRSRPLPPRLEEHTSELQ